MADTDTDSGRFDRGSAAVPAGDGTATAEYPDVADSVRETGTGWAPGPHEKAATAAPGRGGGIMRAVFWTVATIGLVAALLLGAGAAGVLDFKNPFGKEQTDRSQPALLKSIQDLSRYVAAEGNFEVIVDVQSGQKNIPEFLVSQRTLFVAAGSVEAYVDFGAIGEGAVVESADRRTVEIKLPAPQLGKPRIDNDRSYVYAEQRGLVNRLKDLVSGDPNRQQQVYQLAEDKIGTAARDSGLRERAQENTKKMLEGLLRSLGYTTVTVTFAQP
jgi:hypothetical protein